MRELAEKPRQGESRAIDQDIKISRYQDVQISRYLDNGLVVFSLEVVDTKSAMESRPGRFFLLKKFPQSLKSAESYLSRQGWKFSSGCSVKEALDEMMRESHPIALLPVDHSHGRLPELIGLLKRYFQCQVIVYAEVPSPQCMRALEDLPIERKIFPPLIGRVIERELLNAFRDLKSKERKGPASGTPESEEEARQIQSRLFKKMQSDQLVVELLQDKKSVPEPEAWHQKGNASIEDLGLLHQRGEEGVGSELFLNKSQAPDSGSNLLNKGQKISKPGVEGSSVDNSDESDQMMHIKGRVYRRKGPQGEDLPDPDREMMHLKGGSAGKPGPQAGETPKAEGP
ncbi:MAG: hypothetical protein WCH11_04730, partial [Bdellovibrio sp.]